MSRTPSRDGRKVERMESFWDKGLFEGKTPRRPVLEGYV